jgi:hypothetical protein
MFFWFTRQGQIFSLVRSFWSPYFVYVNGIF